MRPAPCSEGGTHYARRLVRCDDDVLRSQFVQVKRIPCELSVRTIETFTPAYELYEQRDGAFNECVRVREQRLVLRASGTGARSEKCAGSGTLALSAGEEVCACGREGATVERKCVAAVDVEAWVGKRAEGRNSRGVSG